jgi:hypothetical protein
MCEFKKFSRTFPLYCSQSTSSHVSFHCIFLQSKNPPKNHSASLFTVSKILRKKLGGLQIEWTRNTFDAEFLKVEMKFFAFPIRAPLFIPRSSVFICEYSHYICHPARDTIFAWSQTVCGVAVLDLFLTFTLDLWLDVSGTTWPNSYTAPPTGNSSTSLLEHSLMTVCTEMWPPEACSKPPWPPDVIHSL